MPQVDGVRTTAAESIWRSPDGLREIFEVTFDYQGNELKAKTYSKAIATNGWSGSVLSEERPGKFGSETWVKQPPKEGGSYPSQSTGGRSATTSGGKFQADPFTMFLSYAKDLAVASVHEGKFDAKLYEVLLDAAAAGGTQLYGIRPGAPDVPKPKDQVSIEDLNSVLSDVGESPWPN